jgi:uridine phosphorylase
MKAITLNNGVIPESELVLNSDGSIYHLKLKPEHIANTILLVGDPGRVEEISSYFTNIEYKISNREFVTHTGTIGNSRLTALSTGIGTDNIDIVINELDALVNIDLKTRIPKNQHTSLNLIRIGTTGSLQENLPVDTYVFSEATIGLDGVLPFYSAEQEVNEQELLDSFTRHMNWPSQLNPPYSVYANKELLNLLAAGYTRGITITANGFYAPQGRPLRIKPAYPELNEQFRTFKYNNLLITNYEMETSALYGLASILGHKACTACAVIANRYQKAYSKDYKITVKQLINHIINRLTVPV